MRTARDARPYPRKRACAAQSSPLGRHVRPAGLRKPTASTVRWALCAHAERRVTLASLEPRCLHRDTVFRGRPEHSNIANDMHRSAWARGAHRTVTAAGRRRFDHGRRPEAIRSRPQTGDDSVTAAGRRRFNHGRRPETIRSRPQAGGDSITAAGRRRFNHGRRPETIQSRPQAGDDSITAAGRRRFDHGRRPETIQSRPQAGGDSVTAAGRRRFDHARRPEAIPHGASRWRFRYPRSAFSRSSSSAGLTRCASNPASCAFFRSSGEP
jgi:hypothetical protein